MKSRALEPPQERIVRQFKYSRSYIHQSHYPEQYKPKYQLRGCTFTDSKITSDPTGTVCLKSKTRGDSDRGISYFSDR